MLSRFVGAVLVLVIGTVVVAADYTGLITEYSSKELTFKTRGKKKGDKGEEKTLKVDAKVAITKGDDTIKSDDFAKQVKEAVDGTGKGPKGVFAKITTNDDDKVTKIEVVKRKGKAKVDKTDK